MPSVSTVETTKPPGHAGLMTRCVVRKTPLNRRRNTWHGQAAARRNLRSQSDLGEHGSRVWYAPGRTVLIYSHAHPIAPL